MTENSDEQETKKEEKKRPENGIFLEPKKIIALSFTGGLLIGVIIGILFTSIVAIAGASMATTMLGGVDIGDTDLQPSDSGGGAEGGEAAGSNLEEIRTDLPYDVNHGINSEDIEWEEGTVEAAGSPYIGEEDAPVEIVTYEDFFCPFCAAFNNADVAQQQNANTAFGDIVENHIETGEVKYQFRHLPVVGGDRTAEAAECVAQQEDSEAFWIFHHEHFENFEELRNTAESNPSEYDRIMISWAEQLDLDTDQYETCLENSETAGEVSNQAAEGERLGAQATPTVFINGEIVEGAQPYEAFQTVIENQINQ